MNIVVYCSSCANLAGEYVQSAEALGKWIGSHGHTLVYGGVNAGLMHTVAQATHDAGGKVIGIIPELFRSRADEVNDEVIFTADLAERKAAMIEMASLFVVLPGGIGTLDEWISTLSQIIVNKDDRRSMIIVNTHGMYQGMLEQIAATGASPFARSNKLDRYTVAADTTQLIEQLNQFNDNTNDEK